MEYFFQENCYITKMLNTEFDPEVSVVRARVLPGVTTQWHSLDGITERYLILEGTGRAEIGQDHQRDVKSGDVVTIPPGVRQRITNTGMHDLVFLAVCTPRFEEERYQSLEFPAISVKINAKVI